MLLSLALSFALGGGSAVEAQYGVCVHCHGAHGEGRPELGTPRLGDLSETYILLQLNAFREGSRGANDEDRKARPMAAVAKGLPDHSLRTLAGYVSALEPEHRSAGPSVRGGAALYAQCSGCHGSDARGREAFNAPDLLFQDADYLTRQLRNYRDGERGGVGAHPLATSMAAAAQSLSDEDIVRLSRHIASLRPERAQVDQYPLTATPEEGLAAFDDIYAVISHPRCVNCHPDGDAPLHTDASVAHDFDITRFSPFQGTHCSTCHAPSPVGDGLAPLPPADPIWSLAPKQMVFENRTPQQICAQLKDVETNGGRGHVATTQHIQEDHLLQTSWHSGRTPPPFSHAELVERFETWGRAGGPCPP